ncbi:MAG: ABC transporter permease, partial [Deltaproteobacteria bacterium]|nr:ABC transporter permease [Deltaproteobacteria bacterium]
MAASDTLASPASFRVDRDDAGGLVVRLAGSWTLRGAAPDSGEITAALASGGVSRVAFEVADVAKWDTALLTFLLKVFEAATSSGATVDSDSLPEGMRRLLDLATAVPERAGARRTAVRESFLERIGNATNQARADGGEMVRFLGEISIALGRFVRGKARYRRSDLMVTIQECGAGALPIVTLISFLVGLILAFVGAVQLAQFGAQIFVADLVGIGMARSMGAMMTGIIMAGRTGAAFAAQLGTMTVNEEIDALSTMGVPPIEFLVLPRMLALMLMMPLLCLYSDLMGMLGGAV